MTPLGRWYELSWADGLSVRGRLMRVAPIVLGWAPFVAMAGARNLFGWPTRAAIGLGWPLLWLGLIVSGVWIAYLLWRLLLDLAGTIRGR